MITGDSPGRARPGRCQAILARPRTPARSAVRPSGRTARRARAAGVARPCWASRGRRSRRRSASLGLRCAVALATACLPAVGCARDPRGQPSCASSTPTGSRRTSIGARAVGNPDDRLAHARVHRRADRLTRALLRRDTSAGRSRDRRELGQRGRGRRCRRFDRPAPVHVVHNAVDLDDLQRLTDPGRRSRPLARALPPARGRR